MNLLILQRERIWLDRCYTAQQLTWVDKVNILLTNLLSALELNEDVSAYWRLKQIKVDSTAHSVPTPVQLFIKEDTNVARMIFLDFCV